MRLWTSLLVLMAVAGLAVLVDWIGLVGNTSSLIGALAGVILVASTTALVGVFVVATYSKRRRDEDLHDARRGYGASAK